MDARPVVGLERPESNPVSAVVFKTGLDIDKLQVDISRKAAKTGILIGGPVQETCGGIGGCDYGADLAAGAKTCAQPP